MRNAKTFLLPALFAASVVWAQAVVFDVDQNLFQPRMDGTLNVTFASPWDVEGELDVYNSAGEQVRHLFPNVSGQVLANVSVAAAWDGLNDSGDQVASGVYFLRLRLGEEVRVRKILVVR